MVNTQLERRYLPARRAALYLGISPQTIRRLVKSGRLKQYRPEGADIRVFDIVELDNFIRGHDASAVEASDA